MIEVKSYLQLPEVIPALELEAWRASIKKDIVGAPPEVCDFIEALANKLDDFAQIGKENVLISGYELMLAGIDQVKGEKIEMHHMYPTPIPYMVATDHRAAMFRIFRRKGKQGLIDFCRNKVRETELERVLQILNVEVFKQGRSEFSQMLAEINEANKIEKRISV